MDYVKVVTQLYKPLEHAWIIRIHSYGILGFKCCILIDDTFDDEDIPQ